MRRSLFLGLLFAAVTACAGQDSGVVPAVEGFANDPRPLARTMVYECNDYEFTARLGPGEMAVWLEDNYLILSQVRSASGVKYEEGDVTFWTKGEDATLIIGRQHYRNCVQAPRRAPWEDARRRGVDFRAVGQEPGWYLEIHDGTHLLFVGEYGMNRISVETPEVVVTGDERLYYTETSSHSLSVTITEDTCHDTMNGDVFPTRVAITVDGKHFQGCGMDLEAHWE